MEIEEGMYIRTDTGYISKILEFREHYTKGKRKFDYCSVKEVEENYLSLQGNQCSFVESIDYSIPPSYPSDEEWEKIKSYIIKASYNLIDLIEVGDILLVNGIKYTVLQDKKYFENELYIERITCEGIPRFTTIKHLFSDNKVEAIITHEQFDQMKYVIE